MSNESILMVVVIGGVAGWLAGLILRGTGYGIIGDIIVGLIGAFIGNWLVRAFHFSVNLGSPVADRIVVSVVGAVFLMLIIGLLRPRSLRERFHQCVAALGDLNHRDSTHRARHSGDQGCPRPANHQSSPHPSASAIGFAVVSRTRTCNSKP